jgi:hypothetical protein
LLNRPRAAARMLAAGITPEFVSAYRPGAKPGEEHRHELGQRIRQVA